MNTSAWESTLRWILPYDAMDPWIQIGVVWCCVVPLVFRYKKMVENLTTHQAVSYSPSLATFVLFWAVVYINVVCPNLGFYRVNVMLPLKRMNRRKPCCICCSSSSEEACENFSNPQQYSKAFDRDDC